MIYYISKKENRRADILNRKINYMKNRKIFNYNILNINKVKLFLVNNYRLSVIIFIIKNNQDRFLIEKKTPGIRKSN